MSNIPTRADYDFLWQQILALKKRLGGFTTTTSGGSGITQLTSDVTAGPGTGSQAATIAADAVTNAKLANVPAATFKGGEVGAGTANPTDMDPDDASLVLDTAADPFVRMSALTSGSPTGGFGGGALVFLEEQTAASSATLDLKTWYSSLYDEYLIEMIGTIPATNGVNMFLTVSTDGGSTWAAANYYYAAIYNGSNSASNVTGVTGGTAGFHIGGTVDNTTSVAIFNSSIRLYNPASTTRVKSCTFHSNFTAGAVYYNWSGMGAWQDTGNNIDALRFAYSSGNIAEGTIRVYGFVK